MIRKNILALLTLVLLASCSFNDDIVSPYDDIRVNVVAQGLSVHNVTTRGSDAKSQVEKEIKSLHIFVYNSEGNICNYLANANATTIYEVDPNGETGCTICAVANVGADMFANKEDGYPSNALTLEDFNRLNFQVDDIVSLDIPSTGIPMVGKVEGVDMTDGAVYTIELKALMARVDIVVGLESDHTNASTGYPAMSINEVTINNIPKSVPFVQLTATGNIEMGSYTKTINSATIYNSDAQLRYTFYVYENMQGTKTPTTIPEGANNYSQNYKPTAADDNDMNLVFNSKFTDFNGNEYNVDYTLYLGANHTSDFNVKRNHQYINTITIKGLTKTSLQPNSIYTYDARVDVSTASEGEDDFYISMLNERDLDAHYAVVPIDIYLIDGNGNPDDGKVTVSIEADGEEYGIPGWLRLEEPSRFDGTAYNGVRDYFTTDLVTTTLANSGISLTPNNYTASSSGAKFCRVYVYVDENLTTKDYEATIKITNENETKTKYVTIRQLGLIAVTYTSGKEDFERTVYMERYEEYLEHWDPLDPYVSTRIYEGLPWQNQSDSYSKDVGVGYATSSGDNATVYVDGLTLTKAIYTKYGYSTTKSMKDGIPESAAAAEYCYDKNKKQPSSGSVDLNLTSGWYMPAIRELEAGIEQNYTIYPEFQNNYYWSSAPAKETYLWISTREQTTRARATKIGDNLGHVDSSEKDQDSYEEGGGRADRDLEFRVRAFWKGTPKTERPYSIKSK